MRKLSTLNGIVAVINLIMAAIILLLAFLYQHRQPEIVTFDLNATLAQYQAALKAKNITPTEQVKRIGIFSQVISSTTQAYSEKHHVIIMVPNAIVAGKTDKTREIQQAIIRAMQQTESNKREVHSS